MKISTADTVKSVIQQQLFLQQQQLIQLQQFQAEQLQLKENQHHQLQIHLQQQQQQQLQQRCSSVGSTGSSICETLSSHSSDPALSPTAIGGIGIGGKAISSGFVGCSAINRKHNPITLQPTANALAAVALSGGDHMDVFAYVPTAAAPPPTATASLALPGSRSLIMNGRTMNVNGLGSATLADSYALWHQQQAAAAHQFRDMLYEAHHAMMGRAAGYYQPAGPLISSHVLPTIAAPPPPSSANVPLLPPKKQQIPPPLSSDPDNLQSAATSTAETHDSDVLITGGDLTPFRYNSNQASGAGAPTSTTHHHQQHLHHHAAHQGSSYPRSMQMHYSTAYPPNYYSPYPSEAMCYSQPAYQPYFSTKVYQGAYRRYPYYQAGPPHPPLTELYEQPAPPAPPSPPFTRLGQNSESRVPQAGPPPTRPPPAPPTAGTTQLVPAGPVAQHLEHYPGPPGYYAGYSPGGGASAQCYPRSLQGPYMDYPTQCPCPMQQSCPKNVHTGPHIGSNNAKMNTTTTTTNTASSSLTNSSNTSSMINSNSCDGSISSSHSKNNKSDAIINGNATYYSNNNGSSNSQSSLSTISDSNNGNIITACANRGPVKNVNTTRNDTSFQLQYDDASDIDATNQNQPRLLQEHSMQHCPLNLLQTVKSELKTEDSDSKSQYEDHVVQPLTPPESYTTNDDKLIDPIEKEDANGLNTILLVDQENVESKLLIENQRRMMQQLDNNQQKSMPMEPYDLTTVTNGTNSKIGSAPLPALIPDAGEGEPHIIASNSSNNMNGTANSNHQPVSLVGRKARIGKTMAREMVYARAAVTSAAHQQPPHLSRILTHQQNSSSSAIVTLSQECSTSPVSQQNKNKNSINTNNNSNTNTPQVPFGTASITSTGNPTQMQNSRIPIVLGVEGLEMLSAAANQQTPIKIKSEIKMENIKVEKDSFGTMIHQHDRMEAVGCQDTSAVLKAIKIEPLNNSESDIPNMEDPEVFVMERNIINNNILDEKVVVPGRMRLLPNWQQTTGCDIDLSDDVLDLSSNTHDPDGSNNSKRIKILEFHKNQAKKSSPNSYKNLIKQAEPRSYLCLSRNVDKRGRYGKSQSKLHKSLGGNRYVLRRQLILTEQQKLRLRIRKKKLMDIERMKQEAKELKRAAARKKRMEESKNTQTKVWPTTVDDQSLKRKKNPNAITGKSVNKLPFRKATSSPKRTVQPKRPLIPALHIVETIDAVARGYFSEPETTRSSVSNSLYTITETTEVNSSVGRKKANLASAEKRSKSETKRPLKVVKKSIITKASSKDIELETIKKGSELNKCIIDATSENSEQKEHLQVINGKGTTEKKTVNKKLIKTKVLKVQNKKLSCKGNKKDVSVAKKGGFAKGKIQSTNKDKGKSTKTSKSTSLVDTAINIEESGQVQNSMEHDVEDIDKMKTDIVEANNNDFDKSNLLECDEKDLGKIFDKLDAQEQQSLRSPQAKQQQHSNIPTFLQPALPQPPVTRIVYQTHHIHTGKRSRSRSKFGCRKRPKLKHSTVTFELDDTLPPARGDVIPKWNNGWTWEGEAFQGAVFLNSDDPLVLRTCYPAMRHVEGDIIRTRDCVLLKANEDNELPYVAKVAHLWENPEDGEMMMSLLWYYRPEHTEQGRQINDSPDEVYASRHRDHNSVACIEDKCYVLTFSEYCRYRRRLRAVEEDIDDITVVPKRPNYYGNIRTVPDNTNPELVMFCRRAYEFRTKRLLKMPNKHDYFVVTTT